MGLLNVMVAPALVTDILQTVDGPVTLAFFRCGQKEPDGGHAIVPMSALAGHCNPDGLPMVQPGGQK